MKQTRKSELKRYPNWNSVPKGLASKSRLAYEYKRSVSGLAPVAQVHQSFDNKWIDLYPIDRAKPKKMRGMQVRIGKKAKK
ncbi:MAG: hypothetical protein ACU843_18725 [Gammaproteobacteria bacterium]